MSLRPPPDLSSADAAALIASVVAERRDTLRAHPADLRSIVPNALAARGVEWAEIDAALRQPYGRPHLRLQRAFELPVGPLALAPWRGVTTCAVRHDRIVAGTLQGELLVCTNPLIAPSWNDVREPAHDGPVTMLAFDGPDEVLLSGGADGRVRLWHLDLTTLEADTFTGHTSAVTHAVLAFDRRLVAGAADGSLRVWDVESGRLRATLFGHTGPITALAGSTGHSTLVSASGDGTLRVWDAATESLRAVLRGHGGGITACAIVPPDESASAPIRIVSASLDGLVKVWTADGDLLDTLGGHTGPVRALTLVPGSAGVTLTGSDDGTVRMWNLDTPSDTQVFRASGAIVGVAITAATGEWRVLAASSDGQCRMWNFATRELRDTIRVGASPIVRQSVSRIGNMAACVSADGTLARLDLNAVVLETGAGRPRVALDRTGDRVFVAVGGRAGVVPSSSGSPPALPPSIESARTAIAAVVNRAADFFATLHEGGAVRYWRLDGRPDGVYQVAHEASALGVSPSGSLLLTGNDDGRFDLWRRESSELVPAARFDARAHVYACRCDESETIAAAGTGDGRVMFWSLKPPSPRPLLVIAGHNGAVLAFDVDFRSRVVVTAGADGTVAVWDYWEGGEGPDPMTAQLKGRLDGHAGPVTGCELSRDGQWILTCSRDATVKMWDVGTGTCLETYYGSAPFVSLSVASGADVVAAADEAGAVHVLRFAPPEGPEEEGAEESESPSEQARRPSNVRRKPQRATRKK